jgi:ATP synthase protein I
MPKSDDHSEEAFNRLEARLDAFEAKRATGLSVPFAGAGMAGQSWRMVWEVVSGFLGGAALGWLVDKLAGTAPWGVAAGLVIGGAVGVVLAAMSAARMGKQSLADNPVAPVADDDED